MVETLTELPSELLYKVLSYLNVKDILQVCACCSDIYEQFSTDVRLWIFLCFRDFGIKPEFVEHSMKFYQSILFPNKDMMSNTFRCGSMIVVTNKMSKGLSGFYQVWGPDEDKKPLFQITMNSEGTIISTCCLDSGDLDTISEQESNFHWEENHCDSPHYCSVEVRLSRKAPSRHDAGNHYHVLHFLCDKGLLYRFKAMGVKGAFSGNTHSF